MMDTIVKDNDHAAMYYVDDICSVCSDINHAVSELINGEDINKEVAIKEFKHQQSEVITVLDQGSDILTDELIKDLSDHVHPSVEGYVWTLAFSTELDGFSLATLYRKSAGFPNIPCFLLIQTCTNHILGAMCTTHFYTSDNFYGTGETYLFSLKPTIDSSLSPTTHTLQIYRWSGKNDYIVKGSLDSISIGNSDGQSGLWLDDALYRGLTHSCSTFDNPPLTETNDETFTVKSVELWSFRYP